MNPADLFRHDKDPVSLSPGEVLFREGDSASEMYVLLEGAMEIVVGGKVVELGTSGALIGEMALIDNSPRSATVMAKTQCRLAKISLDRFHFMIRQNPFFATHVMKVLVQRIRKMDELMAGSKPVAAPPTAEPVSQLSA